jgi:hypothetical protein
LPHASLKGLAALDLRELHIRRQMNFTISGHKITIIKNLQDKALRDSFVYGAATQLPRYRGETQGRASDFPLAQPIIDSWENDQATHTQ